MAISTENGTWDNDLLQAEIGALKDLNFDISLTRFSLGELEPLLGMAPIRNRCSDFNSYRAARLKSLFLLDP